MTLVTDTPAGGDLRFAFDGATHWPADEPLRVLAGWCFGTGAAVRGVELRVGDAVHAADYGLPRPDVAALHPDTPAAATSGFRIPLALPPDRHEIALVALRDGAAPALLLARTLDVEFAPLMGNVESPGSARHPAGRVHVSGWCFHPQARVVRIAVTLRGETHECHYPFPRPDVARAFGGLPAAESSGFEVHVDVPPGRHALAVTGELDSGEILPLATGATVDVLSNSPVARAVRASRARRRARPGGFAIPPAADYDAWLESSQPLCEAAAR